MRHPSYSTGSAPLTLRDPGDLDRRVLLAMAPVLALVRLVLVGEALDLRALRLADDPRRDRGGAELGGRGEHALAVDQHYRPEGDLFAVETLDVEAVAFGDAVLLAAGVDDCVHARCLFGVLLGTGKG